MAAAHVACLSLMSVSLFRSAADDECGGCRENEECHEGECYCKEGYDMDQFKKCYSTEGGKTT